MSEFDAAVIGSGPNGLSAAVELARSGLRTLIVEASSEIGGGARTAELTLPGFRHDVCSAIHPAGAASPFFNEIGLEVEWVHPGLPFAHPLDGGRAAVHRRDVDDTAAGLGDDRDAYRRLMAPFVSNSERFVDIALRPVVPVPEHKAAFARLAVLGGLPTAMLLRRFATEEARSLFSGVAAHAISPFHHLATSAVGLMLTAIGHSHGWPMAKGGSGAITAALARRFEALGGKIELGRKVTEVTDIDAERLFLDVMPPAAFAMARRRIASAKKRRLSRWKPGPAVFKVDWALDGPIPWVNPLVSQAGTVHVGGNHEEVAAAERAVARGEHPRRPFVILAQQSLFDDTRAPEGKHTVWGYCHVPNGSNVDMTAAIESQIERFAPGFRDRILERATRDPAGYERYNPNFVGGDIGGGAYSLSKVLQMGRRAPYHLGGGVYLCSSATPPGAGVHGMCGYHAVRAALD